MMAWRSPTPGARTRPGHYSPRLDLRCTARHRRSSRTHRSGAPTRGHRRTLRWSWVVLSTRLRCRVRHRGSRTGSRHDGWPVHDRTAAVQHRDGPICYVLTVGAENVTLLRLDRTQWSVCKVPDLPGSVDEALWYERDERMRSSHAGGPVGARRMSIISHGSGAQDEDRKERLTRFFQKVDDAVLHYLHGDLETPLVLAGTAGRAILIGSSPRNARSSTPGCSATPPPPSWSGRAPTCSW